MEAWHLKLILLFISVSCVSFPMFSYLFLCLDFLLLRLVFYHFVLFHSCVLLSISLSCFIHVSCFLFMCLVSIPVSCLLFRSQRLCLVFHRRQTVATRYFESLTSTAWAFDDRTRPVRSPPKLNIKKK